MTGSACCTGHCLASDLGPKFNLWNTKAYDTPSASGSSENNGSLPFILRESGKVILGPREQAESQAHSMINRWLEKHPTQKMKPIKNSN